MKTLKQLREDYDTNYITWESPEEIVLEDTKKSSKYSKPVSNIPSSAQMPNLLLFRRITYRKFPDNQVIALYYSKVVDKYLSIPFGPTGNLNLSEASIYGTLEELELEEGAKWEAVKGGLKGAVQGGMKGFYRGYAAAAEPGMAIGTPVGAAIGAYKGAKNAYQKAKQQGMEEESQDDMERTTPEQARKEMEKIRNMWTSGTDAARRKEGDDSNSWSNIRNPYVKEDWQSVNRKDKTDGLSQAAVNAYRRENPGSKLKTAVTEKNPKGKRAARRKSFCSRMGGMKKRLTSAKTARDPDSRINKALRRWNCEESFKMKLAEKRMQQEGTTWDVLSGAVTGGLRGGIGGALMGGAAGYLKSKLKDQSKDDSESKKNSPDTQDISKKIDTSNLRKGKTKTYEPSFDKGDTPVDVSRYKTTARKEYEVATKKQVGENKISDLRNMINEGTKLHEMNINGRTVTLNNSMAKRILEVYDSVNTKNKKIVEGMLNEDLESFKKLLNFSIRN